MKRPIESDYNSHVAYARALEKYTDQLERSRQEFEFSRYSIDQDPAGIRAAVSNAVIGALAFGAQGTNPPPEGHWLATFWQMARAERELPAIDSSVAVGNLIYALNTWKATTPFTAPPAFDALVAACSALVASVKPEQPPVQACKDCNGMGFQDGRGDKCPHCSGSGVQPAPAHEENIPGLEADPSAFVRWAQKNGYDMTAHPLHFLFLDEKTAAARDGWRAARAFYTQPQPAIGQAPIYQLQKADGSWIDQEKQSYDYNMKHGSATVRVVYASPQPTPIQEPDAIVTSLTSFPDGVPRSGLDRELPLMAGVYLSPPAHRTQDVQGWKRVPLALTDGMKHAASINGIDLATLEALWHYLLAVAPSHPTQESNDDHTTGR